MQSVFTDKSEHRKIERERERERERQRNIIKHGIE
jgi:hypothetical protein